MTISNEEKIIKVIERNEFIKAAYAYSKDDKITISELSSSFGVSHNTITNWMCEAIEKRYISDYEVCRLIEHKHVREYESIHRLHNSSLRNKYSEAFKNRNSNQQITIA